MIMTYKDYDNALLTQIRNAAETVISMSETFTFEYIASKVPAEDMKDIEHIYLTGCGDSYCIGIAAQPCFSNELSHTGKKYPFLHAEAVRNIEFTRYLNTYSGWDPEEARKSLVCDVSITGSPVRPREALARMNELGGKSVAFTDNEASEFAKIAKYAVRLGVPQNYYKPGITDEECPGMTSYIAGAYAVMMFGLYINVCKGYLTMEEAMEQRQGAIDYAKSFTDEVVDKIDAAAFELAKKWEENGFDVMDFVSEEQEFATAFFGSAKMVESFGAITSNDDAEDWCHISFFNRRPKNMATVLVANESSRSFSRDVETVGVMDAIKRPVMVVTDSETQEFPGSVCVFRTPKPKYRWANALLQHLPIDFVAAYIGIFKKADAYNIKNELQQRDADCVRFKKSKLVIVK